VVHEPKPTMKRTHRHVTQAVIDADIPVWRNAVRSSNVEFLRTRQSTGVSTSITARASAPASQVSQR
jgi:hypothetical protein